MDKITQLAEQGKNEAWSDGNKPSDDKLEDFGANPISSENKTPSEHKKSKRLR